MADKTQRIEQVITETASRYVERESNKTSFITVTRTVLDRDGRKATIYCTVFPESKEQEAIDFLSRKEIDFKEFLRANTKISRIPYISFEIDKGEKNRARIDELLSNS